MIREEWTTQERKLSANISSLCLCVHFVALNLNRNDANAQSVSKSIPNDLEDAKGKLLLCKSAIHKGQMFLHFLSTLTPYRLSEENPLELIVPPCTPDVKHRGTTAAYSEAQYCGFPRLSVTNLNGV